MVKKKKFQHSIEEIQARGVGMGKDSNKEHMDGWAQVFGAEGRVQWAGGWMANQSYYRAARRLPGGCTRGGRGACFTQSTPPSVALLSPICKKSLSLFIVLQSQRAVVFIV